MAYSFFETQTTWETLLVFLPGEGDALALPFLLESLSRIIISRVSGGSQHSPTELPAVTEMFSSHTIQYGSHQPPATCGFRDLEVWPGCLAYEKG